MEPRPRTGPQDRISVPILGSAPLETLDRLQCHVQCMVLHGLSMGLSPVGRNTFVNHAALALFGHVRSTRGKQHQPLLPSRVASLASEDRTIAKLSPRYLNNSPAV